MPFWAAALGYVPADPPEGHASWRDYYLSIGVPEAELDCDDCVDRLVDRSGNGPPIWFQIVPVRKSLKNRLHLDLKVGGGRAGLPLHRLEILATYRTAGAAADVDAEVGWVHVLQLA